MRVKRLYGKAKVFSCFRWNERDCGNSPRWRTDGALNQNRPWWKIPSCLPSQLGSNPSCWLPENIWGPTVETVGSPVSTRGCYDLSDRRSRVHATTSKGFRMRVEGATANQSPPDFRGRSMRVVKWMLDVTVNANDSQHQHFLRCQQPCQSNEPLSRFLPRLSGKTEPTRTKSSNLESKDPIGTQMLTGSVDGNARFYLLRRCSVNVEWM